MNNKINQNDDTDDPSYQATLLYHQLISRANQHDSTIQRLIRLLNIEKNTIEQARLSLLSTHCLWNEDPDDINHLAEIHVIHSQIDALIGPEGLGIITILGAMEKPAPRWMLEQATLCDQSAIGYELIEKLHAIRISRQSLEQRVVKASELLNRYQKLFPIAQLARQRMEDCIKRLQYVSAQRMP